MLLWSLTLFIAVSTGCPTAGSVIKCNDDKDAVYRLSAIRQLRLYPTPAIASSWDPTWEKFVTIDCTKFPRGPAMRHREGSSIKCLSGAKAVFRIVGNERRWYPTEAIAASWDPKWKEYVYVDCTQLKRGPDMKDKKTPGCGSSIRCQGVAHAVFRIVGKEIRVYPSPAIASSWDPTWTKSPTIDCTKFPRSRHAAQGRFIYQVS